MARFSALLDACVLVPITQADTLLRLAEGGLFRPLWSDAILDETVRALGRIHPDLAASGAAHRRTARMNDVFDDANVAGYEPLIPALELPDLDDRHVLAAAITGGLT